MKKYFKGWNKEKGFNCVAVYDDEARPKDERVFLEDAPVAITKIFEANRVYEKFDSIEEAEKAGYYFVCQIDEKEYDIYMRMYIIFREIFMHDIFHDAPREDEIKTQIPRLKRDIESWMKIEV